MLLACRPSADPSRRPRMVPAMVTCTSSSTTSSQWASTSQHQEQHASLASPNSFVPEKENWCQNRPVPIDDERDKEVNDTISGSPMVVARRARHSQDAGPYGQITSKTMSSQRLRSSTKISHTSQMIEIRLADKLHAAQTQMKR
ncbi:hypothetical protein WAI453_000239 [Rhynchosporium graminicola]